MNTRLTGSPAVLSRTLTLNSAHPSRLQSDTVMGIMLEQRLIGVNLNSKARFYPNQKSKKTRIICKQINLKKHTDHIVVKSEACPRGTARVLTKQPTGSVSNMLYLLSRVRSINPFSLYSKSSCVPSSSRTSGPKEQEPISRCQLSGRRIPPPKPSF